MDGQTFAGIIVSLCAAFLGNFGVNTQKLSFIYELRKAPEDRVRYFKQPWWWFGMIFVVSSALGNFAALALAPQSVVSPIGAVSIVSNLIMANRFLGEPLTRIDIAGALCICTGMALAVVFSGTEDQQLTIDDVSALWIDVRTLVYAACALGFFLLYYLIKTLAEAVLQAHIQKVGELLMQEAAKVGLYDHVPGGGVPAGSLPSPKESMPTIPSASSMSEAALLPQDTATPGSTTSVQPVTLTSATLTPTVAAPAAAATLGDTGALVAAAETVKRENKRADEPSYAPPNMTAFMKDVDEVAASALQAAGRRQRRESTPAADDGKAGSKSGQAAVSAAGAGSKAGGSDQDKEDDGTFVDLDAVADIIGAPPAGYDWYASLHPLAYAGLAGVIGAQNTLFAKAVGEGLTSTITGDNQFTNPLLYVYLICLVASIVFQQHFLASGLQLFDALYIVPVFKAHFILFGVLSGGLFYREFDQYDLVASIMFPIGLTIGLSGVLLLTLRKGGSSKHSPPTPGSAAPATGPAAAPASPALSSISHASPPPHMPHGTTLPVGVDSLAAANEGGALPHAGGLQRSASDMAPAGRSVDLLDLPSPDRPAGRQLPGGRGEVSTLQASRRGRTFTEGLITLSTRSEVEAAREVAATNFAQFVAAKAVKGGAEGVPLTRRGTSFLRNTWVESLLERKATLDGVVSFALPTPDGADEPGGPGFVPPQPPQPRGGDGRQGRKANPRFSIQLAGGRGDGSGGAAAGTGPGGPTMQRSMSDGQPAVQPPPLNRSMTGVPRSRRTHRQSMLVQAYQGLQALPSTLAGGGEGRAGGDGGDSDEEGDTDVMAFGFDSQAELAPHITVPAAVPPGTEWTGLSLSPSRTSSPVSGAVTPEGADGEPALGVSPAAARRAGAAVVVDAVARGVASISQLFLANHAEAAMTSGTYAGRAGPVSLAGPAEDTPPALADVPVKQPLAAATAPPIHEEGSEDGSSEHDLEAGGDSDGDASQGSQAPASSPLAPDEGAPGQPEEQTQPESSSA